jgi:shikimate dehydrogenase
LIKGDTRVHSLFGSPIAHSLSPIIFNTTFQKLSLNRTYIPFDVAKDKLSQALDAARTLEFDGFNVTMPLKTTIPEMLDELDKSAQETGAVNTVDRTENGLVGYNTDGEGAMRTLESYSIDPMNKRIVVIGSGGAAQALVHKLASQKNTIRILNRTINKARKLIEAVAGQREISYDQLGKQSLQESLKGTDLLINATPAKTTTLMSQYNIPLGRLKDVSWVFDLSYDKPQDPLLPLSIGTISPLEMLLQQAALSYEIWLKNKAPLSLMRSSLVDYIGKDWK